VPLDALLLALAAAVVHATWNLLLAGAEDTHAAAAVAVVFGTIAFAPVAAFEWRFDAAAAPFAAASAALELVYLGLLASAYAVAAMSLVYPVARGSAPVLVLLGSVVVLGTHVSALAAAGVALVACGVLLVRGVRGGARRRDLALALAIACCIASYTLVDKHGIRHASALAYLEVVFGATAVGYLAAVARLRGPAAVRAAVTPRTLVAGLGFYGSYALTLAALRLAPAPSVAAVRETSVLIAAAVLALGGRERVGPARVAGAAAVAAGIACIALG
jgi:drug/metabolite transporter (DMT)-like permease